MPGTVCFICIILCLFTSMLWRCYYYPPGNKGSEGFQLLSQVLEAVIKTSMWTHRLTHPLQLHAIYPPRVGLPHSPRSSWNPPVYNTVHPSRNAAFTSVRVRPSPHQGACPVNRHSIDIAQMNARMDGRKRGAHLTKFSTTLVCDQKPSGINGQEFGQ